MPTATVTSKGQVTIPRKVREALRLRPGDRIDFVLGEDGEVRVRAGEVDVSELRCFSEGRSPPGHPGGDGGCDRKAG